MIFRTSSQFICSALLFLNALPAEAWNPHHLRYAQNLRRQAPTTETSSVPNPIAIAPTPADISTLDDIFSSSQILQDLADLATSDIPDALVAIIEKIVTELQAIEGALSPLISTTTYTSQPISTLPPTETISPFTAFGAASSSVETIYSTVYSTNVVTITANSQALPPIITPTSLITLPYNGTISPTSTMTLVSTSVVSVFDPYTTDNIAVYFGSAPDPVAPSSDIDTLCQDPNINIINIAFVTSFFGSGGFPVIDFGTMCSGQTYDQTVLNTNLESCNALGNKLQACQAMGKKIFVSINVGGTPWNSNISSVPNTSFPTQDQAVQLANTLWDLFGNGSPPQNDSDLRPLGVQPFGPEVIVDGFDVYFATLNSSSVVTNSSSNYSSPISDKFKRQSQSVAYPYFANFFAALRNNFATDNSKAYYLSVSLPCSLPPSLDETSIQLLDWVSMRAYGDPSCDISQPFFAMELGTWINNVLFGVSGTPPAPSSGTGVSIAASTALGSFQTEAPFLPVDTTIYQFSESTSTEYVVEPSAIPPAVTYSVPTTFPPNPTKGHNTSYYMSFSPNATGRYPFPNGSHPTLHFANTMIPYTGSVNAPSPSLDNAISSVVAEELERFRVTSPLARGISHHPLLLLGLLAPPNPFESGNAAVNVTAVTAGTAGAIPIQELTTRLQSAARSPGFGGVMIWGAVGELESSGEAVGFVEEVKDILDEGLGVGIPP